MSTIDTEAKLAALAEAHEVGNALAAEIGTDLTPLIAIIEERNALRALAATIRERAANVVEEAMHESNSSRNFATAQSLRRVALAVRQVSLEPGG